MANGIDIKLGKRAVIDWEAVEREYRAGIRSLRDIASEFGCAESAIRKKATKEQWTRDLAAKVNQRADELVRKAEVRTEVRTETSISEKEQINASAQMLADKVLNQRRDIQRARSIVQKLWDMVDTELDHPDAFKHIGEVMRAPDEFGQDKLNDMYFAAISLPQQVKNVKLLAYAIKTMIELERKVLRIDTMPDTNPEDEAAKAGAAAGRAVASGVDAAMKALADKVAAASK